MTETLDEILRRVASGELTPQKAEALIAALGSDRGSPPVDRPPPRPAMPQGRPERIVRLQVMEGGRAVVNLRVPMSWAGLAGSVLPGLSGEHAERLRDAIRSGSVGRILEVEDEDGDGVIISTE